MLGRWWTFVAVIAWLVAAPAGAKPRNNVQITTDALG
jgi:hypothetical protein